MHTKGEEHPRILIVKLSSLGDLFHALPTVHCLKKSLRAEIDWVVQPPYEPLVQCFTDVDRTISYPRQSFFKDARAFISRIRQEKYDYVIDLQGLFKSAMIARFANARRRIGPSFSREGARLFYGEIAGKPNKARHAVEELYDVTRYLGLEDLPKTFPVRFPDVDVTGASPRIAIVPCSRWPSKNWSSASFIRLGEGLREKLDASLYLLGDQSGMETCAAIGEGVGVQGVTNLCGSTSLLELGSYLQKMDLVISVDSGPMHMAAALAVPVLALFGVTDPTMTGPFGDRHRVLTPGGVGGGPIDHRQYKKEHAWSERLPVDEVLAAAIEMIDASASV